MTPRPAIRRRAALAALLCGGTIVPIQGWAHWEGFEAADPSTPAALLRFESAAAGYVEAQDAPVSWITPFENDMRLRGGSHNHGNPEVPEDPADSSATEPVTGIPTGRAQPAPQTGADRG